MLSLDIKHLWHVWRANVRASLVREMEFRANFLLGLLRQILWLGVFILMIESMFAHTRSLAGWQKNEVLVILALSRLVEGIMNALFARNIGELPDSIRTGRFDYTLTKPLPSQFFTAFQRLAIHNLGNIVAGVILFVYALVSLGSPAVWSRLPLWLLFIFLGIVIFYSLLILVASLAFFLERLEGIWAFMNIFSEPLTVPFDIFPARTRIVLTYLLPLAFIVFIPAQVITGRLAWWHLPLAALIAFTFLSLANLAWRAGLRRYTSASS